MKTFPLVLVFLLTFCTTMFAQDGIYGTWQAIDDEDGQPSSIIEIFEEDGKVHGKIVKILTDNADALCDKCEGVKHNQPIQGMEIVWGMEAKGSKWKGGRIMDPKNGKTYKCKMEIKDNVLQVRGYIGLPTLGRTQKWYRAE